MQNNYRLHSSTVLCVHINAAQFLHQHTPSVFNSHFIILPQQRNQEQSAFIISQHAPTLEI